MTLKEALENFKKLAAVSGCEHIPEVKAAIAKIDSVVNSETQTDRERLIDAVLRPVIASHGLQAVVESLRRVVEKAAEEAKDNFAKADKWQRAANIIVQADRALYGQHCGDLP